MIRLRVYAAVAASALTLSHFIPEAHADTLAHFSPVQQALYVGMQTATLADWTQTRTIAKNPHRWVELNPILGKHPHVDRVDAFMATRLAIQHFSARALPDPLRTPVLVLANVYQWRVVKHNHDLGIRPDAPDYVLHAAGSAALGAVTRALLPDIPDWQATAIALTPGLIKELTDDKFSARDMVANTIGAYLGVRAGGWAFTAADGGVQVTVTKEF